MKSGRRPTHVQHAYQQDKGKNIVVDEEGFQTVKNRKNTRRNIFPIVNDERRSSAFALAEGVQAARYCINQQGGESSWLADNMPAISEPSQINNKPITNQI